MRKQNVRRRPNRKMQRMLSTLGGLALLNCVDFTASAQSLMQTYVNFSTDPSWIGVNNRTGSQNYGWSNSDNTGSSVNTPDHTASGGGELGGSMTRSSSPPNFYGVNIGTVDLHTDAFSVSGVVRIYTRGGSSNWMMGYSQGITSYGNGGPKNFIGFIGDDGWDLWGNIWDRNGSRDRFDISTNMVDPQNFPGDHIATGVFPFKFVYSPTGGSQNEGYLDFTINNTATQRWNLSGSQKSGLDVLTHFGIFPQSANGGGLTVYWDDLDFTMRDVPPPPPTPVEWGATGGGDWFQGSNWVGSAPPSNVADSEADFLSSITGPATVYADDAVVLGKVKFSNASNSYNITGAGSLTLQSATAASVQVDAGSHKLNIPVTVASNTTVTVAAGATLRVSDPVTVVSGKTLTSSGSGSLIFESTVTLLPSASLALSPTAGGTTAITVGGLSMGSGSGVDIGNNSMVVIGSSPDEITPMVRAAYHDGAWDGNGIGSSAAKADSEHRTGVGITDAPDGNGTLVKYTWYGDANVDGKVDSGDFNALASHFGASSQLWASGDFNYDGKVDTVDFNALAGNFGASGAASAAAASLGSQVPEPAALSLLSCIAVGTLRRRTHKQ
jgi:hypothetical protein